MSNRRAAPLPIGRVAGFRGNGGEVTVKVASAEASRWVHLRRVTLRPEGGAAAGVPRDVESARAYRDRLVLKLKGVDDANGAEALRGCAVEAAAEDVPALPEDVYWVSRLVGARVRDAAGDEVGRVEDVVETGGTDLLVIRDAGGNEVLVPLAREIVRSIDDAEGIIVVALPGGLREINAGGGEQS